MSNLTNLVNDLAEQEKNMQEAAQNNFNDNMELTPEEEARLTQMKEERTVSVAETDEMGRVVNTPVSEYAANLDNRVKEINELGDSIKTMNSGDITASMDDLKKDARDRALKAFREMSVDKGNITDDDYIAINNSAIEALMERFKLDKLDFDTILKKLAHKPLREICSILPEKFVNIYVTPKELAANNIRAKERLLSTIGYLAVTGPEMDYLNDYIEEENKLAVVSKRLLQCQIDFANMLQDKDKLSDILKKSYEIVPLDTSFWAKYIKQPNKVHNEFAQRVVINQMYREAYEKLLADYAEIDLTPYLDNPERMAEMAKEAAFRQKARKVIQDEIEECNNKIQAYSKVCDMNLLHELWATLTERYTGDKRVNEKYLFMQATDAIDRIRKSKQNVPFPSYDGSSKRADMILKTFMISWNRMVKHYNNTITDIQKKNEEAEQKEDLSGIDLIHVDQYPDDHVINCMGLLLVILMGRVMKALSKNDRTKYDAIMLDSYFQLFCQMGTDIYIMSEIWNMMKDFVLYALGHYYYKK